MSNWCLKALGRFAAAVGESHRYSPEHLQWLRGGYACTKCGAVLTGSGSNAAVRCYDDQGNRIGRLRIGLRGKTFECPCCGYRWPFRSLESGGASTFLGRFVHMYVRLCLVVAVLTASFIGTYAVVNAKRVFPAAQTIVVYGRDSCAITTEMRARLLEQRIPFIYANVDSFFVDQEMWRQLQKPASSDETPRVAHLPVVLVNHQVLERPDPDFVIAQRSLALAGSVR